MTHFLLEKCFALHIITLNQKRPHTFTISLIHSAKCCCYKKSLPEGVLSIKIFLLCIPLLTKQTHSLSDILYSSWYFSHNTDTTVFRPSQDILLLKGTKYHLSLYDKMQMLNFLKCQCYISVQFPPYSRRMVWNLRQTGCIKSPIQINISNCWQLSEIMIFP
jgi:hypothetical protein